MTIPRTRTITAIGAAAVLAVGMAGCSGGASDPTDETADGPIELTLATFNDFGYTDELLQQYEDEHPNVTIVQNIAATSNDARSNFFQKLGAGSGLADVEAIEVDWVAEMMQYSDLLADLSDPGVDGRWLDWKTAAVTDADGRLVGYGTDIGPEGVCYRADLFEEAGLPTDREEVAAMLEGDWDTYYEVGRDYTEATGKAWFDSAGATFQGLANQMAAAFENPDTGEVIAADNPEVEAAFRSVLEASADLSAHRQQWSDDWFAALAKGDYATMLCPGWMLGVISGNAPDTEGWDIANVFPGGGGNWGGSYLTVPAQGEHVEAAKEFAAWLTSPEVQLQAFDEAGTFPSQLEAYESDDLTGATDEYFNEAPVGEILIDRANAITVSPYKGAQYFPVMDLLQQALTRVEDGTQSIDESWAQFEQELGSL